MYATDMDLADWPLVCFLFEGRYYINISLPFGLRWVASHCQDVISLVSREFRRQASSSITSTILGGVAASKSSADTHFSQVQGLLSHLGL